MLPRTRVKLALDGVVPDVALIPGVSEILFRELTLDLFEQPQRERIREAAVGLAAQGLGPRAIAARIVESGDKHPTATAVQNALALDRLMKQTGLPTPYVHVSEPPEDYAKLCRHKNAKYHFTPLDGYVPPTLSRPSSTTILPKANPGDEPGFFFAPNGSTAWSNRNAPS